jgi:hypothetical protein
LDRHIRPYPRPATAFRSADGQCRFHGERNLTDAGKDSQIGLLAGLLNREAPLCTPLLSTPWRAERRFAI